MKKAWILSVLLLPLLLWGCDKADVNPEHRESVPAETTIQATVPPDGNPEDVTCKGSYTGSAGDAVVANVGSVELTNEQLQVWYWAEVARYRQEQHHDAPDFDLPLDTQPCGIDSSVNSWQQYFLKQALSSWHSAQALIRHSQEVPLTFEEAYQPNTKNTEKYMTGMPAAEVLYGYYDHYRVNSMHQAYLDGIPRQLEDLALEKGYADVDAMAKDAFGASQDALETYADVCNRGYMYFTHLSYSVEPTQEELDAFPETFGAAGSEDSYAVDFRQILLIPGDTVFPGKKEQPQADVTVAEDGTVTCEEDIWASCEADAQKLLKQWKKKTKATEATFADLARKYSKDPGTTVDGGRYQGIRNGQLTEVLNDWCFDPQRQTGDTVILRSDYGIHILYFSGKQSVTREEAVKESFRLQYSALIGAAREAYPMTVRYADIALQEAAGTVSVNELLYPDIAHERYPAIPLYLQQDYPNTMYGGFLIRTNGCGITSFAMIASYLLDDEVTPPEMCARYGRYSHSNGTDGMLFINEPAVMGFYLREKTYDARVARQALEDGHVVVSIQHAGYWTGGGHYIVCESINEDGLVQVRDSNIFNYGKLPAHGEDAHTWGSITRNGSGYWIFEDKVTRIPACGRCGSAEGFAQDYTCEKCETALLRRNAYLNH